jgi:hypothetical protein
MPTNLYDAIANNDLEGMIYLYSLCAKQSLELLNGQNVTIGHDTVHQSNLTMSGECILQYGFIGVCQLCSTRVE